MIKASDLLAGLLTETNSQELEISSVQVDSRFIEPGCAYVAVRGEKHDGHSFIASAVKSGASLIIGEEAPERVFKLLTRGTHQVRYVQVLDSRAALALIAANYYGRPSSSLLVIGVTGTSGKTTTTYIAESILSSAGHKVGVIGTVNYRFAGVTLPADHTTPGALDLQRLLYEMKSRGCTAVVMEVSSHALKQQRTAYVAFDVGIFTNLSREHMDFHPDMEDYFASKALLFKESFCFSRTAGKEPSAVINSEDDFGRRLIKDLSGKIPKQHILKFGGTTKHLTDVVSDSYLKATLAGISGRVGDVSVKSALMGRFNAYNILAAIGMAKALNLNKACIEQGIAALSAVPGRLEQVKNQKGIHVFVDYAHKPDALEKVLRTLGEVKGSGRIITVFGCGGDRDKTKRPVMGQIAVDLSDLVVVTSDNPRTEDPGLIINEILAGIQPYESSTVRRCLVESDRRKAIWMALNAATRGDILLIAGKGHETYQIVSDHVAAEAGLKKTVKIDFDDRKVVSEFLAEKNTVT
ncbi:MAG: UDP-N-acetylmuramoyl-L-alanyl-D-glutamate--2,6-diaminopimelate ligase [Bdellovibrionota bacterium]